MLCPSEETKSCKFITWQCLCQIHPSFPLFRPDWQGPHIFCGTWKIWFACKLLPFRLKHCCHSFFKLLSLFLQKRRGRKSYLSDTPSPYKIKQNCAGSGKTCFFETCQPVNERSVKLETPEGCTILIKETIGNEGKSERSEHWKEAGLPATSEQLLKCVKCVWSHNNPAWWLVPNKPPDLFSVPAIPVARSRHLRGPADLAGGGGRVWGT